MADDNSVGDGSVDASELLRTSIDAYKERFVAEKTLLTFSEYLDVVCANPDRQLRSAATYLIDCFLHYGTYAVELPYGAINRFALFDCPFDDGRDTLVGQELVQNAVFGFLTDFSRHGHTNRLILLHGPNGSAKTRFVDCVMRALEHYSRSQEGAMYTFSWVFPSEKAEKSGIGFGSAPRQDDVKSFSQLTEQDIDSRLANETRDHPLLLLPKEERLKLISKLAGAPLKLPAAIAEGDLSPKAKMVFDALLKSCQGDLDQVLKYVQVERIHISRRYRQCLATVDPQMRVDAGVRQVTADRSLGALPASIQNLTLFEPMGDLVDANRGVLEFNDLLKRPVEAFKYILSTCESGTVRLDTMSLQLDTVFFGTCNAEHLSAFKQIPDFSSFKARTELIQVPYLTDFHRESQIYWELLRTLNEDLDIGPHVPDVLALWAVLCRLDRPINVDGRSKELQELLRKLTPIQKAKLYARGEVPPKLSRDLGNQLRSVLHELYMESSASEMYEGRFGPSPRELKAVLLSAARQCERSFTGMNILDALRELCEQKAVYPFLHMESDGEYHNPIRSIAAVRTWYLDLVEEELHRAMGLVDHGATIGLLSQYIDHVVHFIRKEKRINPITGRPEEPDETFMGEVETRLGKEKTEKHRPREALVHRIAAWRMDHPEDELDYETLFADFVDRLNESFYAEKQQTAQRMKQNLLSLLVDEEAKLSDDDREHAEVVLKRFEGELNYPRACAIEVIASLLRIRAPS